MALKISGNLVMRKSMRWIWVRRRKCSWMDLGSRRKQALEPRGVEGKAQFHCAERGSDTGTVPHTPQTGTERQHHHKSITEKDLPHKICRRITGFKPERAF